MRAGRGRAQRSRRKGSAPLPPPWKGRGGAWEKRAGPPGPSAPLQRERRRAGGRRRDPRARAGACPPASRKGKCTVGEGHRFAGKDGRCIRGGLAAGGCAGGS